VGSCCGAVWVRDYGTVGRAMLVTVVTADSEGQQGVYSVGSCCGAVWVRDYDTAVSANNTTQNNTTPSLHKQ